MIEGTNKFDVDLTTVSDMKKYVVTTELDDKVQEIRAEGTNVTTTYTTHYTELKALEASYAINVQFKVSATQPAFGDSG